MITKAILAHDSFSQSSIRGFITQNRSSDYIQGQGHLDHVTSCWTHLMIVDKCLLNGMQWVNFPSKALQTRYHPLRDVMIAGQPRSPVWCRLPTVPTDPITTFTSPTDPFLSEWVKCQPRNTQNGGTVLLVANLMAESES